MKKHLKYIDGSSDKFWQIEVVDMTYTVTYGRNGTSGVSQVKTFSSTEECLKAAEKLLNEKVKKGYSESGDVIKSQATGISSKPQKDTDQMLKTYDRLILSRDLSSLLPFLQENAKGNLEVLRKHIKKCKKYWMSFIDLDKEPEFRRNGGNWGTRGDINQTRLITASAVALFDKTDIQTWDEVFDLLSNAMDPPVLEIIKWSRPLWIAEYIMAHTRKNEWRRFSYPTLRLLEQESLIVHHPELFAICMASFNEYNTKMKTLDFIHNVAHDPIAYGRDVPELFNYETDLHNHHFRNDDKEPYNAHSTWEHIYNRLLQEGKLSRDKMIEEAILIQTKDWNIHLRSFFRKRLADLDPNPEELVIYQENIFACLHNSISAVANFALELIRKIYDHKKFATASFLDWMEPVMMNADNKTGVKNALMLLEKINKQNAKFNKKITSLIADVYFVPDMNLQERATKILLKIASPKDKDLKEKLSGYTPLMQGNIRSILHDLLIEEATTGTDETAIYQFAPKAEKLLHTPVELPKNWNDILYLFGKFIASDEVADAEILANTFVMQTDLFPWDYPTQLQPYKQQLEKKYFNNVYKAYVDVFLRQKIENYRTPYRVQMNKHHKIQTLLLGKKMLEAIDARMESQLKSPLLSFPTHLPHWVAPKVLLERLVARQQYHETIDLLDLSIAISRMPRENVEEAIPLLDQLTGEIKELMAFCLGVIKEIPIKPLSLVNKFFSKITGPKPETLTYVWAVAARTYYPDDVFQEFEATQLRDLDFAISPFRPEPRIKECWNDIIVNYRTMEKGRSPSWYELNFDLSTYKQAPHHYLFIQDNYGSKKGWEYQLNEGDVYYWNSLMPQQNDPLGYFLLRGSGRNTNTGGADLKGFLNVINAPGFRFSPITILAFACMFFQEKKETRIMAAEVLINLIEKQAIDLILLAEKIAYLASNKYGAFSRLVDSLAILKDVSDLHNSGALQLLEGIIMNLSTGDKLPVNFKRMAEHYVDLLYRTKQQPATKAIQFFEKYKETASLKSLTKQILS